MIKNNLRELMKEKGVTITELHNVLNISRPTLTKIANDETDGIRYDTINKLCKFFKITPNELLVFVPFDEFECNAAPFKLDKESDGQVKRVYENPKKEIKRIEEENTGQLTDLNIGLLLNLKFDKDEFIYASNDVKYLPGDLLYVSLESIMSDAYTEYGKNFFSFVHDIYPAFRYQFKAEIADHIRKTFMLDSDVDIVIVADFMRILEGKE